MTLEEFINFTEANLLKGTPRDVAIKILRELSGAMATPSKKKPVGATASPFVLAQYDGKPNLKHRDPASAPATDVPAEARPAAAAPPTERVPEQDTAAATKPASGTAPQWILPLSAVLLSAVSLTPVPLSRQRWPTYPLPVSAVLLSAVSLTPVALSPFPLGSLPLTPCALRTIPPAAITSAATAASGSDRDTVTVAVKIIRHEPPALNGIVVRVGVTGTIWSRQYKAGVLDGSELFEYPDGRKDYFRWSNGKQIAFAKFDSSNSEHAAFLKASADANHQMEVY